MPTCFTCVSFLANCSAGNYRDVGTNKCKPCDKGYYQPDQWQTSCIQCPTDKTTATTGSISQSMCQCEYGVLLALIW